MVREMRGCPLTGAKGLWTRQEEPGARLAKPENIHSVVFTPTDSAFGGRFLAMVFTRRHHAASCWSVEEAAVPPLPESPATSPFSAKAVVEVRRTLSSAVCSLGLNSNLIAHLPERVPAGPEQESVTVATSLPLAAEQAAQLLCCLNPRQKKAPPNLPTAELKGVAP